MVCTENWMTDFENHFRLWFSCQHVPDTWCMFVARCIPYHSFINPFNHSSNQSLHHSLNFLLNQSFAHPCNYAVNQSSAFITNIQKYWLALSDIEINKHLLNHKKGVLMSSKMWTVPVTHSANWELLSSTRFHPSRAIWQYQKQTLV